MKIFLVLSALIALSSADIGYQYRIPSTSYGVPVDIKTNSDLVNLSPPKNDGFNSPPQLPLASDSDTPTPGKVIEDVHGVDVANVINVPQYVYQQSGHKSAHQQQVQKEPQVFKHTYFYTAPEEPEPVKVRQNLVAPAPEKHYKVIFIKTPTVTAPAPIIQQAPQVEEKTLVYVLVNKPEEQTVELPKLEARKPSKPEVFFIKYKDNHDSVVKQIVSNLDSSDALENSDITHHGDKQVSDDNEQGYSASFPSGGDSSSLTHSGSQAHSGSITNSGAYAETEADDSGSNDSGSLNSSDLTKVTDDTSSDSSDDDKNNDDSSDEKEDNKGSAEAEGPVSGSASGGSATSATANGGDASSGAADNNSDNDAGSYKSPAQGLPHTLYGVPFRT